MKNEEGTFLIYGMTRGEVIQKIIDFEIENDVDIDLRDILENGFTGYNYVDDTVLVEQYHEYFDDEHHGVSE